MTRIALQHEVPAIDDPETDFIPRRARESDTEEVEWRRTYAGTGALILRQQFGGIGISRTMLDLIEDPHEKGKAAEILAATHISTVRHIFQHDPEHHYKLRHNIQLPVVATVDGWRETPQGFQTRLDQSFDTSAELTSHMITLAKERKQSKKVSMNTARAIGNTGTILANFPLYRLSEQSSAKDIQLMVRESAKAADERALKLTKKFGIKPSLAMLVDDTSVLATELRTSPMDAIAEAYEEAYALYDASETR